MDAEIKFRVAAEDKARLQRAAGRAGRSLSDWVRQVSLAAVDVELGVVIPPVPLAIQEPGKIVTPNVLPSDPKAIKKAAASMTVPGGKSEGRKNTPPSSHTITGRPHGPVPKGKK